MREGWVMSRHWPLPHQVMIRAARQPHPAPWSRVALRPVSSLFCFVSLLPGEELCCGFPLTVILPINGLPGSQGTLLLSAPFPG